MDIPSVSVERSQPEAQVGRSGSLTDLFDTVFKDEEFESEYERECVRNVARWIDLVCDYVEGKISTTSAYFLNKEIQKYEYVKTSMSVHGWSGLSSIIYQFKENVEFLIRRRWKSLHSYYSAMPQYGSASPFIPEQYFKTFKYFVKNPLSSISSASRALSVHPATLSKKLRKLESEYHFFVFGSPNRWLFGLRTFFLFFALNSNNDKFRIAQDMASFPYFYALTEDPTSNNHYMRFILPDDENLVGQLRESISSYSESRFKSWNLDELIAADYVSWTKNVNRTGYSLPQILLEDGFSLRLRNNLTPRLYKRSNDPEMTFRDFVVLSALAPDLRQSARVVSKSPLGMAYDISEREAYYRKTKLLSKKAIVPVPNWVEQVTHTLRLEATCNREARHSLLSAAYECTPFIYSLTTEGIQIWQRISIAHLNTYTNYFKSLLTRMGVAEFRFTLSKSWGNSPQLMDLVGNWNYGPRGFTTEGLNLSADIYSYI